MNLALRQPGQLFKHVREVSALGADRASRRRLARHMVQANLKRLHYGWFRVASRILGTGPVDVRLRLPNPQGANAGSDRIPNSSAPSARTRRFSDSSRPRRTRPPRETSSPVTPFSYRAGTTDLLVLEQVFVEHEYDSHDTAPDRVDYLLDLGSNIGLTALLWARRYPTARLVLVEPDPDNFALLQRNTASFRDRCLLINAAVADQCGRARFFRAEREYGHSIVRTPDCVSEIDVQALTLNAILDLAQFPRLDVLKMDIEGGEQLLMPTITEWRRLPRYLIAELHPPYEFEHFAAHCGQVGLQAVAPGSTEGAGKVPFAVLSADPADCGWSPVRSHSRPAAA